MSRDRVVFEVARRMPGIPEQIGKNDFAIGVALWGTAIAIGVGVWAWKRLKRPEERPEEARG